MGGTNQHAQLAVPARVGRRRPTYPGIKATPRDVANLTQVSDYGGLLRLDERESYSLSFAKKAAAFLRNSSARTRCSRLYQRVVREFLVQQEARPRSKVFNTSRSTHNRRFSLRSRRRSSRSSLVKPVWPFVRSARARRIQLRNADSVRSSSRATRPTLWPVSSTSQTAPALNSSSNSRRGRRGCFVFANVDIVSVFQKVSTKLDQAQSQ